MRKRTMRKSDIILLVSVMGVALLCLCLQFMTPARKGNLIIQIDGKQNVVYSLDSNMEFEINEGSNKVKIKDGKVSMTWADCPDQICVHHRAISKNNETIVCLPNRIILLIESVEDMEVDATTN